MGYEALYSRTNTVGEVEILDVRRVPPEPGYDLLRGGTHDLVDLLDLVEFVGPWEQGKERDDLEHHAPDPPQVHLEVVVPVGEQGFRRSVPSRGDVLGEGRLGVNPSTRPEVGELELLSHDKHVLGLDVPVEDVLPVHERDSRNQLVHVHLDECVGEVLLPASYELVDVHVKQLKYQRQPTAGLVEEHIEQLDDVGMRVQPAERLDLAEGVDLVDALERVLHALDRHVLAVLDALSLDDLAERPLALLRDEPVLGKRGHLL
eukprot:CAMPEP_0167821422 /NCGR_PEP_ID=MMETSP0112_2-20121227/6789_1 /TAXON_ID=91324 /ORGANISM="Lotharella globosa, Strain CCCM811" /LENGTH=260 /DNA_ID=CAMNT_0007722391 /DNA_START=891 /DNA_END=1669 /DNA_ORIENTATION=+